MDEMERIVRLLQANNQQLVLLREAQSEMEALNERLRQDNLTLRHELTEFFVKTMKLESELRRLHAEAEHA